MAVVRCAICILGHLLGLSMCLNLRVLRMVRAFEVIYKVSPVVLSLCEGALGMTLNDCQYGHTLNDIRLMRGDQVTRGSKSRTG